MHKKKRIKASVISLFLVFALVLFTVFIAKEANHHCTHEKCEICSCLSICRKIIDNFSSGLVALFGFAKKNAWIVFTIICIVPVFIHHTLVKWKVELTI